MGEQTATRETARRLVGSNRYLTLATADADGRPWASPVWYAPVGDGDFLWVSDPEARHSRNIARRPEVAIVIFDSTVPVGGAEALYCDAIAEDLVGDARDEAIATFSRHSEADGAHAWGPADVSPPARLRLYRATVTSRSVLGPGDRRLPLSPRSASSPRAR
jgi:nitroimidazol reductase NimA-like FMN-containing flavoprotein (pyridoxamine 5'-phosphate oxidase superfamily)